jgi:hypothetical protein
VWLDSRAHLTAPEFDANEAAVALASASDRRHPDVFEAVGSIPETPACSTTPGRATDFGPRRSGGTRPSARANGCERAARVVGDA